MRKFLSLIFDFLFPPSADELLVRNLTTGDTASLFKYEQHEGFVSLSHFRDARTRALIHEAKFFHNKKAFSVLHTLILRYLEDKGTDFDIIIPIPLSKKRLRGRGHNQITSILTAGDLPIPIYTKALLRIRHTTPQTDLTKAQRLTNLTGAFVLHPKHMLQGKRILLIDDVSTTGTTLREAKKALLEGRPESVMLIALAH